MKNNIIFCFSGTGNCLHLSKELAENLPECEIVSMSHLNYSLDKDYDSVGFIFPVYFWGLPAIVDEFISSLKINNNLNSYFYTVASYGASSGGALGQINGKLAKKNVNINYSESLQMFSNYVVFYDMAENVEEITEKSNNNFKPIIENIKNKYSNAPKKPNFLIDFYYSLMIKNINNMDTNYSVSADCISCGICADVCPVNNIEMVSSKPSFKHKCQGCVACIQYCPKRAINYKNKTQKRRRYTNPAISSSEIKEFNLNK